MSLDALKRVVALQDYVTLTCQNSGVPSEDIIHILFHVASEQAFALDMDEVDLRRKLSEAYTCAAIDLNERANAEEDECTGNQE